MASFYKTCLFFYIIITATGNIRCFCNESFNPLQCVFEIFCQNKMSLSHNTDRYLYHPRPDVMDMSNCKVVTSASYSYGNRDCYPLHLVYKDEILTHYTEFGNPGSIPALEDSVGEFFISIITHMDLDNNNYEVIPEFKKMTNLAVITLSKNSLTVAKLSNPNSLPSLTEIDLSHNTISDIQYEEEQIYRGLKKIDLSYNYLTKIPDAAFDTFNELVILDVSHNYIDMLSSFTFEGMKQLSHLNISYNRISDIKSSLFRFNELKFLDLSNNKIKAIKTSDFNKLISLETLDLSFNLISSIEKDSFLNMHSLSSLYLNNNKLENIDKETLHNVSQLVTIDLSENYFKLLPKGLFKGKSIQLFSVKNNRLEGTISKGTFEGLLYVSKLDLSSQHLSSIVDYAFYGLDNILVLLLNDNNIQTLSPKSFRTLTTLKRLDLSYNKITNIEFEKDDLFNLFSLSLRNNHLNEVKHENFQGFNSLQFLDLSDNKITHVETNSFKSLKELINFEISNNPLSSILEESTFDGLNSLPSLDISCTLLSTIQNGSFIGMVQLKQLNVSHSKINTLEYNIFIHTGAIETLDLSFNDLKEFNINSTELSRLDTLYINNNLIKTLDSYTFGSLSRLSTLALSNNIIQNIKANVLTNQSYLRSLDISFNSNFKFTSSILNDTKNVNILNLSGIKTGISFGNVQDIAVVELIMSNSSVTDVKSLHINELLHLDTLNLSYNNISKLAIGNFYNLSTLRTLDLSHNKITYIQPGVFKDNTLLYALNISHNLLTVISYGIFHGLIYLNTLDISFNNINDLQNERFYEVKSLSVLIADHNKIESINADDFLGTSLIQLSIGENPIPCEVFVNFKRNGVPFQITASRLYENNDENVDGVTCNKKHHIFDKITNVGTPTTADNTKVLFNIRDILLEHLKNRQTSTPTVSIDDNYLMNITSQIQISNSDMNKTLSKFLNSTMQALSQNNETNVLLIKILRVLTLTSATKAPPVQINKDNATYENLLSYMNRMRQDLEESIKLDRSNILNEIDAKISAVNSNINLNNALPTEMPKHEKLNASADNRNLLTETCVVLILIMLVGFVLYKVYKSRVFVRQSFSVSTRELPGAMDSTL